MLQKLLPANFAALLLHQFEECRYPRATGPVDRKQLVSERRSLGAGSVPAG
jgi:hypothetical protein